VSPRKSRRKSACFSRTKTSIPANHSRTAHTGAGGLTPGSRQLEVVSVLSCLPVNRPESDHKHSDSLFQAHHGEFPGAIGLPLQNSHNSLCFYSDRLIFR